MRILVFVLSILASSLSAIPPKEEGFGGAREPLTVVYCKYTSERIFSVEEAFNNECSRRLGFGSIGYLPSLDYHCSLEFDHLLGVALPVPNFSGLSDAELCQSFSEFIEPLAFVGRKLISFDYFLPGYLNNFLTQFLHPFFQPRFPQAVHDVDERHAFFQSLQYWRDVVGRLYIDPHNAQMVVQEFQMPLWAEPEHFQAMLEGQSLSLMVAAMKWNQGSHDSKLAPYLHRFSIVLLSQVETASEYNREMKRFHDYLINELRPKRGPYQTLYAWKLSELVLPEHKDEMFESALSCFVPYAGLVSRDHQHAARVAELLDAVRQDVRHVISFKWMIDATQTDDDLEDVMSKISGLDVGQTAQAYCQALVSVCPKIFYDPYYGAVSAQK